MRICLIIAAWRISLEFVLIFMEDAMAVQDMGWHSFCMSTMSSLCAFDGDFRQFLTDLDCPQVKFVCGYY